DPLNLPTMQVSDVLMVDCSTLADTLYHRNSSLVVREVLRDAQMNNPERNYVLYITNHFTHPMKDAQLASPRYHLTRALARKGVKLIVYCPLGRVAGKPLNDFFNNLRPRRYTEEKIVYLFPPLLRIPGRLGTGLSLVIGTLFLAAFVTLTRT